MHILTNKFFQLLLSPISLAYGCVIHFRNLLYDYNILPSFKIHSCTVICVGNITVGGTGKTPAVEFLANYLHKKNKKVAVLSRGYGRISSGTILVSEGQGPLTPPEISGDEPYLLAQNLKDIPVVAESDRYKGAKYICETFSPEYLILDDGFQHRRLRRDVDIVLYDCSSPFGLSFTLPGGKLREPLGGMKRADMIWFTRVDQTIPAARCERIAERFNSIPIIKTKHAPYLLKSLSSKEETPLSWLSRKNVCIFSGIGHPEAFRRTILELNTKIVGELRFPDHHQYTEHDLKKILQRFRKSEAEVLLTTEKDAIRLKKFTNKSMEIYYLRIEMRIIDGTLHIEEMLKV